VTSEDQWPIVIGILGAVINAALLVVVYVQVRGRRVSQPG